MSIYTFNNKVLKHNNKLLVGGEPVDPYNPLGLPQFTIRLKFKQGVTPYYKYSANPTPVLTLVSQEDNIWDLTYLNEDWNSLLYGSPDHSYDLLEILGANTSSVTNMNNMLCFCFSLTSVSLFDTTNVTSMANLFYNCPGITTIPLFNTSNVTNMNTMFYRCRNVQSGALALYQQASTQTNVPSHSNTFEECGSDTQTGAAELAQIPTSWGGTMQ